MNFTDIINEEKEKEKNKKDKEPETIVIVNPVKVMEKGILQKVETYTIIDGVSILSQVVWYDKDGEVSKIERPMKAVSSPYYS